MAKKDIKTPVANSGRAAKDAKIAKAKAPPFKAKDAKPDDDDDEDDDDDDDDDAGKALDLAEDDLSKALEKLEAAADEPGSRKQELLEKAIDSDLDDTERQELFGLMGQQPAETVVDRVAKSLDLAESPIAREAFDISDFLREEHEGLTKAFVELATLQKSSAEQQGEFNIVLAQALAKVGRSQQTVAHLCKAMSKRLGIIEAQPAREPKSAGVRTGRDQVVEKSFAGQPPPGEKLTKSQVFDALDNLMEKSVALGHKGRASCGEDIALATAQYESTNQLTKAMAAEVRAHVAEQRSAAH